MYELNTVYTLPIICAKFQSYFKEHFTENRQHALNSLHVLFFCMSYAFRVFPAEREQRL